MTVAIDTDIRTMQAIEGRIRWLATAMIDHANRVRPNPNGLKVGGHQASSASISTIMTSLWFRHLRPEDRVSVKPHASPVLHAISYLLGELDESYLTRLREFGGLQSYPSRHKDPDTVDYSTGSVGIGATAPIWGTLARRFLDSHVVPVGQGRQYSLLGDAELDEGACWEAILDPMVGEFGEVVWVVDFNRQSLDRVIPTMGADRFAGMFVAAGWQVITVKYGKELQSLFAAPGGAVLRDRIDQMTNQEYQRLLQHPVAELRQLLPGSGPDSDRITTLIDTVDDQTLHQAIRTLGGNDLGALDEAFAAIDDTRPTVIIAYTVKGHGLSMAGHPQNHSALLTEGQLHRLADEVGVDPAMPWQRFADGTPEALLCVATADRLRRSPVELSAPPALPEDIGRTSTGIANTQAALGRVLVDLIRVAPEAAARIVTISPDVSSSTNLAGWVNKVGVWAPAARTDWFADDADTVLHWREQPTGSHIELGIAETNLVGALGELGATWSRWGEPLLPIGVLYDPFVERALEPWSFGIYAGGQSILVGTPAGVTLAAEGGAHQSIKTPSIGLEQPGCISYEPAFVQDLEWTLLASLARLGKPEGSSSYFRLSTRPVDQRLANVPAEPAARARRRKQAVAGGYLLRRVAKPALTICAMGAVLSESLGAADVLDRMGFAADVVCITSPGLLFQALQARRGMGSAANWILDMILPADRARPLVTVLDGHPHSLAFLATVNGVPATHLGVSSFGQSGDLESVYQHHGLSTDAIVCAGLDLVD